MRLLISDVAELQDETRLAETRLFMRQPGYRVQNGDSKHLILDNGHSLFTVTVPVLFKRYDRDHFLSVHFDGQSISLPYMKKNASLLVGTRFFC